MLDLLPGFPSGRCSSDSAFHDKGLCEGLATSVFANTALEQQSTWEPKSSDTAGDVALSGEAPWCDQPEWNRWWISVAGHEAKQLQAVKGKDGL